MQFQLFKVSTTVHTTKVIAKTQVWIHMCIQLYIFNWGKPCFTFNPTVLPNCKPSNLLSFTKKWMKYQRQFTLVYTLLFLAIKLCAQNKFTELFSTCFHDCINTIEWKCPNWCKDCNIFSKLCPTFLNAHVSCDHLMLVLYWIFLHWISWPQDCQWPHIRMDNLHLDGKWSALHNQ